MGESQSVPTPSWLRLAPDERVLVRARPSSNLLMGAAVGGFFLITLGAVPFIAVSAVDTGRRVTFALTGLVVVVVLAVFLLTKHRAYAITDRRVAVAVGLADPSVRTVDLEEVREVSLDQGRLGQLLGVGMLRFQCRATEDLAFTLVGNPHGVYERALDIL